MKRSNRGKAYFYAYGQRDKSTYGNSVHYRAIDLLIYRKAASWPMWAQVSYQHGFNNMGIK